MLKTLATYRTPLDPKTVFSVYTVIYYKPLTKPPLGRPERATETKIEKFVETLFECNLRSQHSQAGHNTPA